MTYYFLLMFNSNRPNWASLQNGSLQDVSDLGFDRSVSLADKSNDATGLQGDCLSMSNTSSNLTIKVYGIV